MNRRNSDDSDRETQALAEAMEKDPIGVAKAFDQAVRLQFMASGSKPSMEAAGFLHGAVQMSLRMNAAEVALGTLPLLLDVFSRAPDLHAGHTDQLAQLAKEFQNIKQHDGAVKILETVVSARRRFFGAEHAGTWTARAELADALRKARQLDRAREEIDSALRVWETSAKTKTEGAMRATTEALLHSVAGVIAPFCRMLLERCRAFYPNCYLSFYTAIPKRVFGDLLLGAVADMRQARRKRICHRPLRRLYGETLATTTRRVESSSNVKRCSQIAATQRGASGLVSPRPSGLRSLQRTVEPLRNFASPKTEGLWA